MTNPSNEQHDAARSAKIREVVEKCRQWLAKGNELPTEQIVAKYPQLKPELAEQLEKLQAIEQAKQQVESEAVTEEDVPQVAPLLPPRPKQQEASDTPTKSLDSDADESGGEEPANKPPVRPKPSPPRERETVQYFGDYELVDELARGGMGVVYKARQVSLNRTVALKMILAGQLASKQDVQRFYAEAEAAAALDHSNIVPIYEVGQHEGQHYFAMGFVEGRGLDAIVRDNPLPSRKAAEYIRTVAEAIQYAHDQGVLHRDIKPSNVLIDAGDQPKVTDFGLAKKTGSDSNLTATGQVLGTPSYMPPEQAFGEHQDIGPASDVYSLGATLYCLLTGRAPFQGDSAAATLMQVIEQEPVSPRLLNPAIDADLETIVLKCLEKERGRRYMTARELTQELDRYLRGRPIKARPISRPARAWRWCKRNPVVAGLSAAVAVVLLVGAIVSSALAVVANQNAELAETRAVEAEQERNRADAEVEKTKAEKQRANQQAKRANKEADRAAKEAARATEEANKAREEQQRTEQQLYLGLIQLADRAWHDASISLMQAHLDCTPLRHRGLGIWSPPMATQQVAPHITWTFTLCHERRVQSGRQAHRLGRL